MVFQPAVAINQRKDEALNVSDMASRDGDLIAERKVEVRKLHVDACLLAGRTRNLQYRALPDPCRRPRGLGLGLDESCFGGGRRMLSAGLMSIWTHH